MNWQDVIAYYDLPQQVSAIPLGGTAAQNLLLETPTRKFILRCRPPAMAAPDYVEFDHALRIFLADHGFPAPRPVSTSAGRTWLQLDGNVYELSCVLPGATVAIPNSHQLYQLGRCLALYHVLAGKFEHPGKQGFLPEDHISILQPLLDDISVLAKDQSRREKIAAIQRQLDTLSILARNGLHDSLENSIIHGDFHPGNVLFKSNQVSALLDYDYAARGPILRDIADGLVFFAARRPQNFDPNNIWSLTQAWKPDTPRAVEFLKGYTSVRPLPEDWPMINYLLIARWLQVKLRGSRKVPAEQKVDFVLVDLPEMIHWLEQQFLSWLTEVIEEI